jgi:alginate O-acetyltransferase complex protein AlgI
MFGIALPFNFDSPYKSRSIIEFWRRWHITLSRFLRDYLYIPIGGSRHGEARRYLNLAVTMLLGGLWHGAGWTFIVWGGLHGLFLIINHGWAKLQRRSPAMRRAAGTIAYALLALVLTQLCVVIAWVFFRSTGVGMARRVFLAMFHIHRHLPDNTSALAKPIDALAIVAGYLVCLCMPNVNEMFRKWRVGLTTYENPPRWSVLSITWRSDVAWLAATTGLVLVSLLGIVFTGNGTPFLYFQF